MIQETKLDSKGRIKVKGFTAFERVRDNKGGGGIALLVKESLHPVWVNEGEGTTETLSVIVTIGQRSIHLMVGYGPQESSNIDDKEKFWKYIEDEYIDAVNNKEGFILQMDGNLWAGEQLIPGDPRKQNINGQYLQRFLEKNKEVVLINGTKLCKGIVTRLRDRSGIKEESVLDFVLVSDYIAREIIEMVIDDERIYPLTNYRGIGKAKDSDHFTIILKSNIKIRNEKAASRTFFQFKNKESQVKFKAATTFTDEFTNVFKTDKPVISQLRDWRRLLWNKCTYNFPIIRKKKNYHHNIIKSELIQKRNELKTEIRKEKMELDSCDVCINRYSKDNYVVCKHRDKLNELKARLNLIETEVKEEVNEEHVERIKMFHKVYNDADTDNINIKGMWKMFKTVGNNRKSQIPTARLDHNGYIIKNSKDIIEAEKTEIKERLRRREIREEYNDIDSLDMILFEHIITTVQNIKTKDWTLADLEVVLKELDADKAKDNEGFSNVIFKEGIIGDNLKDSLLILYNKIKNKQEIGSFLKRTNVAMVHKKGSPLILSNARGVFLTSKVRNILMKLVYNTNYETISCNMSDFNMGARKNLRSTNNILIVQSVIHESIKNKNAESLSLQILDYMQMFDSISLEKAIIDLYNMGFKNEHLSLLYKANCDIKMAVRNNYTSSSVTDLPPIVMQGDTMAPITSTVHVDTIVKEWMKTGDEDIFMFKGKVPVPIMGMVDDQISISKQGIPAQRINSHVNMMTAVKGLQYGDIKCVNMTIRNVCDKTEFEDKLYVDAWSVERKKDCVNDIYLGKVGMKSAQDHKYLGIFLNNKGKHHATVKDKLNKAIGQRRTIMSKLEDLQLGKYYFQVARSLRQTIFLGSILYGTEALVNLGINDIEKLEKADEELLRMILKAPSKTPKAALYVEMGAIPIRYIIMMRRLNYYHYISNLNDTNVTRAVVEAMKNEPTKGDWFSQVAKDMADIDMVDQLLTTMSRNEAKQTVKKKVTNLAVNNLKDFIANSSKLKNCMVTSPLMDMALYLLPNHHKMTRKEKQSTFLLRSGMFDIGSNYSWKKGEYCPLGCTITENLEHVMTCDKYMSDGVDPSGLYELYGDFPESTSRSIFRRVAIRDELLEMEIREKGDS